MENQKNLNLTDFPNTTINDYREAYEDVMFEHYDMDGRYFDDFMCEHEDELANYVMNDGSINLVPAVLKFHGNKHRTSITWNDITNKQINKIAGKKLSKSMRIKELSNEWRLVRDVKIELMELSIDYQNEIKECDDSIFETFFEGKVDSYNHCIRLLTQLEDKLRVETIPDGLRQLNEWGEQSI